MEVSTPHGSSYTGSGVVLMSFRSREFPHHMVLLTQVYRGLGIEEAREFPHHMVLLTPEKRL